MTHFERLRREALAAPESGIVAIMNYARGREGLIPLWTGEGDLPTPSFISEAAAASLVAGETFYTWQRGIPELRQAIARYAGGLYGIAEAPERFFVTQSGMQAIQISIAAIAGPGDEIAFIGPAWPNFEAALALAGGVPREVPLDWTAAGWQLDPDRLRAAIGPKTKALFINTPSNPTGWTADHAMLQTILAMVREAGIVLIADEIYSRFYYGGRRAPSFHDVMEPDEAILFVNSFSKNWAMTGWRVGWIEAPAVLGDVIENLIQYSSSGVAAFLQRAAIVALDEGEGFVDEQVQRAHRARDVWTQSLARTNRVRIAAPEGAFYSFFAIDGLADTQAAAFRIVDEIGVGLAPGSAFGPTGAPFLRACFHRRIDEVEEAANRLVGWIGRL